MPRQNVERDGAVYISVAQLRQRYGNVSHMWVERKLKSDPDFPRPVTFGSMFRFFKLADVEAYERAAAARPVRGKGEAA